MSRDGTGPCCGDTGSIALAESTSGTGKRAGISFHNGGADEGNLVLEGSRDGSGRGRRLIAYDNQGQGMRIEADDFFIRNSGRWASATPRMSCYWTGGVIGQIAYCAAGYAATGCSSGQNKGSFSTGFDGSNWYCYQPQGVDWTAAQCCAITY